MIQKMFIEDGVKHGEFLSISGSSICLIDYVPDIGVDDTKLEFCPLTVFKSGSFTVFSIDPTIEENVEVATVVFDVVSLSDFPWVPFVIFVESGIMDVTAEVKEVAF
jgi:hypothetical protein